MLHRACVRENSWRPGYFATGSLARFGQMGLLSVRLIETETTMINAAVSQFVERPDEIIGIMQRVSHNVLHEIRRAYPLQVGVVRLTLQGEVVLDIGAQHGVTSGLVLHVFDKSTAGRHRYSGDSGAGRTY